MIKKIFWITDFSEESRAALEWARLFCERYNAQLVMVHVVPDIYLFYNTLVEDPGFWVKMLEEAKAEARKELEALSRETGAKYRILEGTPYREIVALAEREGASLLVMAWGQGSGQTAIKVARKAPCPVLVVKGKRKPKVERVLYTTDLSETSAKVLPWVSLLARTFGAEAIALHVIEAKRRLPPDEEALLVESIKKAMPTPEGVEAKKEVVVAPRAWEGVANYLAKNPVDLVAIASHGRSGLARVLMGSVAERVLSEVAAPVMVIKA